MLDLVEGVLGEFAERATWGTDHWSGLEVWLARRLGFPMRVIDPEGQRAASARWRRSPRGRRLEAARHRRYMATEGGRAANRRAVSKWRSKPENRARRNAQRRAAYAEKKLLAALPPGERSS